jgi:hypothetical protein
MSTLIHPEKSRITANHNQRLSLGRIGRVTGNHNQTLVRPLPIARPQHNQTVVRSVAPYIMQQQHNQTLRAAK